MGNEPDPEQIPPSYDDFIEEIRLAMIIYNKLQDRWEGFSGSYMGKDYTNITLLFEVYGVTHLEVKELILDALAEIDNINIKNINERIKREQKGAAK